MPKSLKTPEYTKSPPVGIVAWHNAINQVSLDIVKAWTTYTKSDLKAWAKKLKAIAKDMQK